MSAYLERALFVIGDQNDGKSSAIRDVFSDYRFGNEGKSKIGSNGRLTDWTPISNERWLHIRLTSPHEYGDGYDEFFSKINERIVGQNKFRWNFLGALQTNAFGKMPNSESVIEKFYEQYKPERVRVCLIFTGYSGKERTKDEIWRISSSCKTKKFEFCMIDAQQSNGLFLADYFDFT